MFRVFMALLWALLSACLTAGCGSAADRPGKDDLRKAFHIHADVVEALEGGPIVLKVTLRCQLGRECPAGPYFATRHWHVKKGIPPDWRFAYPVVCYIGLIPSGKPIAQGQEVEGVQYIHKSYNNIKSGKHRFTVAWPVYLEDACIASPETTVDLTIAPADDKHLTALCHRLQSRLAKASEDEQAIPAVLDTLSSTSHRSLAPVAWRLLEINSQQHESLIPRILTVLDGLDSRSHIDERLVRFVNGPANWRAAAIFQYWNGRRERISIDVLYKWMSSDKIEIEEPRLEPVSDELLRKVLRSGSIWAKVMAYDILGPRCRRQETQGLFAELEAMKSPVSATYVARLLKHLDSDDFAVREAATAELISLDERAEAQLRESLRGTVTPEVRRRVRLILDEIENAKSRPQWQPALAYLAHSRSSEAQQVLECLAKGDTGFALSVAARKALRDREEYFRRLSGK